MERAKEHMNSRVEKLLEDKLHLVDAMREKEDEL